ncbi:MAG TPA: molybdenum cofactor guanylyltransferase [Bryobacteraceae bacterium]|nr:molybdenum cofactor guanylyltransferase [Bryobacteraceae bacterium]
MPDVATRAGFLLVGGRSTRMGRDKARLPLGGRTLAEHIAERIRQAAGSVMLVGTREDEPLAGFPDLMPGNGPLGGVFTALHRSSAEWNLIVACDMPEVTRELFEHLFRAAESSAADCVVPGRPGGALEPLCAIYHRRVAAAAHAAINRKSLKMHDFVSGLKMSVEYFEDPSPFANINTPEQWSMR